VPNRVRTPCDPGSNLPAFSLLEKEKRQVAKREKRKNCSFRKREKANCQKRKKEKLLF